MAQRFLFVFLVGFLLVTGDGYGQPLSVSAWATSSCGPQSTVTITATGGTQPYVYTLDGASQALNVFVGIPGGGPHTISVQDNSPNPPVTMQLFIGCIVPTLQRTASTCGANNAKLHIDQVGAAGTPYFSIDGGATYQASPDFSNLSGINPYTVWVKDDNNTIAIVGPFVIGDLAGATVQPSSTAAGCPDNDGTVTVQTQPGTGSAPFTFALDNVGGPYGPLNKFTGVKSGTHTAFVTDVNGCVTQATVAVQLNNTLTLSMGPDATICESKSTTLAASSPNGVSYAWTPTTGLNNPNLLNPVASPGVTTAYSLVATWGACTQTGQQTVYVHPAPIADAGPSDTTCYGVSVQLAGGGRGGAGPAGGYTYHWTPDQFLDNPNEAGPFAITPTSTVVYHLQVTDADGCTSINDATATVTVLPPAVVKASADTNVVGGQPVPLHAFDVVPSGFVSYEWTPAEGLSDGSSMNPVWLSATETTTFVVKATDPHGCSAMDTVTVKVFKEADIYVPSAFSPNHDGHNDVLRVIAPSLAKLQVFAVYDRWGAKVFETSNPGVGWDGTRGGKEMPTGTYVWMAVGVTYQGRLVERKGTVVLVR